jgi:hypothetical protein
VAADLRHLRREAPDRAGRGRDPDQVALAQLRDPEQPGVSREAASSEDAEERLGRRELRVDADERGDAAERGLARLDDGYSRQPAPCRTASPGAKPSAFNATTSPTVWIPSIGSPSANEATATNRGSG